VHEIDHGNDLKRKVLQKKLSTIFVCEFITAGGFNHADLPEYLVREGMMMRDALLRDLSALPYEIHTTVDARISVPGIGYSAIVVEKNDDVWQVWERVIQAADAVWLIAPETDGYLKKLTELAARYKKTIFGCNLESIQVTSSKLATYHALNKAGIATIPTYTIDHWPKGEGDLSSQSNWLAKPDDGAGCSDTVWFKTAEEVARWVSANNKAVSHVIQPYQTGVPASISCVMHCGKAHVLSCNKQLIEMNNHQLSYHGSVVNGMREYFSPFEAVANKIAQAMPDLAGYVGIDVIVEDDKVIVVEINPRLTTSYAGLAAAIGANPAELIINTLTQENYTWPKLVQNLKLVQNKVELNV